MISLFAFVLAASLTNALVIDCNHQKNRWTNLGDIDECIVYYLKYQDYDDPITQISIEMSSIDAKDILSFYIRSSSDLYYIPSGLADHFINLKVLVIAFTGLKTLRQSDFKPLQKLENIYLDNNELESIEGDIFAFNPNIRFINLESNKIKSVANNVFDPLARLQQLNFSRNICYSGKAESQAEVEELKEKIYEKCAPVDETDDLEYAELEPRDDYKDASNSGSTSVVSLIILTLSMLKVSLNTIFY